jgi:hypothetical protein
MATFTWYSYYGSSRTWTDISTNTIVFCGSSTDLSVPITVGSYQDGTHIGTDDPGTDVCTVNHVRNVKYVSTTNNTQFQLDGGASESLSETNMTQTECTLYILFNDAATTTITNARFYCFNSTTATTEATGITAYAVECKTGVTNWTKINDSGSYGGDNTGERLDLLDQGTGATNHSYYISVSASPQTVGAKTAFDLGIALTYT